MPKPICVKCGLFFRPAHNGFVVEEGMPDGGSAKKPIRWSGMNPNDDRYLAWSGYKLWRADKWKCRGCGVEIVTGYAQHPAAEHYQPDYDSVRRSLGGDSIPFIHDC